MCTAPARKAGLARIRLWRGDGGLDPLDSVAPQRVRQPAQGLVSVPARRDHLRQERVVVNGDLAARLDAALVTEPGPLRQRDRGDGARRRQEASVGILGVDPALDRRASRRDVALGRATVPRRQSGAGPRRGRTPRPPRSRGAPPGAGCSSRESRSGPLPPGTRPSPRSGSRPPPPRARPPRGGRRSPASSRGAGRLLDELLVPPLDRAVALEEVDQRAVVVTQDLDLDVPGPLDGPLDVDRRVAEGGPARRSAAANAASSAPAPGRAPCRSRPRRQRPSA